MRAILRMSISLLITLFCYAESPPATKPACNAHTRGTLWPENAGRHSVAGPVEMCSMHRWKYRWEQVTVDVSQLRANATRQKAPASSMVADAGKAVSPPEASE
jgi:hypothetical protein